MPNTQGKSNRAETFICPWWLIYLFDNPLRQLFHSPTRILRPLVAPGDIVLDMGCGMGYFTISLAEIVGPAGRVMAVDIQPKMLQGVDRRARRHAVTGNISSCRPDDPDWKTPRRYDFILAFWMLHEVPDRGSLLVTLRSILKESGRVLLVEPRLHVRKKEWQESLALAGEAGFASRTGPSVAFSRTVILQ